MKNRVAGSTFVKLAHANRKEITLAVISFLNPRANIYSTCLEIFSLTLSVSCVISLELFFGIWYNHSEITIGGKYEIIAQRRGGYPIRQKDNIGHRGQRPRA